MKQLLITIAAVMLVGCGERLKEVSFHQASINGDEDTIKKHLEDGVNERDKNIALILASVNGHVQVADLIIKYGGDINTQDEDGETPLHFAAIANRLQITKLLIDSKANINLRDKEDHTPLDVAVNLYETTEIADLLRENGGKHGTIHGAARGGDIEAVKEFLAAGADVNAKTESEWTPLLYAAFKGHKEIAELLIAEGADVNAKILLHPGLNTVKTPLDIATMNKHPEIVDLLRKHGGKTGEELKAEGK